MVPSGNVEVISSKALWSTSWLGWPLRNGCIIWKRIRSVCRGQNTLFLPGAWLITRLVTDRSSTTDGNSAAGTVYHSRQRAFTSLVFSGVRFQSLVSYVICYRSVFVVLSFFYHGNCIVCPSFGNCIVCPAFGNCIVCPAFGNCIVCPPSNYCIWLPPLVYSNFSYFPMTCKKVICINVIDILTDIGII